MSLGDNFNDTPTFDESDSSSQPPPGRPGDTEDFFVPYNHMTHDNSANTKVNKARIKSEKNDDSKFTVLSTYSDDEKKENNDNDVPKQKSIASGNMDTQSQPPIANKKKNHKQNESQNSMNSDTSMPTPVPSPNQATNGSHSSKSTRNNYNNNNRNTKSGNHSKTRSSSHNNKKYNKQSSIQRDFSRATKWDIVYLTSSPLVFGSDPYKPLDQLDISGERDAFFNTLKASKQKLRVIHKTATTSNIIAAVTGGCRCIHYSGHGYPSYLAFEDAKRIGETHLVHYDLIRKVCEDEDQRIEFVFASACHSEHVGEAFIEAGIQHVVAVNTKFEVTDEAASVFTKHFYNTLLNGRTIEKSFKIAKHAVAAMSSSARLDYDKFLLLPRNGDHDVHIFGKLQSGELVDDTLKTPINNLPPAVPSFVGRAIDMRHIIHQLMDSGVRLLVLTGNSGIGKSATALMVARYFCDRRMFRGGIFFIDVKKLNNECKSLSAMLLKVFEECDVIKEHRKKYKNKSKRHHSSHNSHHHVSQNSSSSSSASNGHNGHNQSDTDSGDDRGSDDSNDEDHGYHTNNKKHRNRQKEKEDVFNIIRNMGEMLLVFDGLDQFGETNNNKKNKRNNYNNRNNHNHHMSEIDIQDAIQAFLQNIFEKCSIDTKVLVTSSKKLHMFADFTNCISRYYMLRKLKPKDAAKLFSRLCNQFRHTDIVSNHELMRILEYNPKQITRIVQIKHQYHCDTLEKIVKAYNTKVHLQHQQEYQNQQKEAEQKALQQKQQQQQQKHKQSNSATLNSTGQNIQSQVPQRANSNHEVNGNKYYMYGQHPMSNPSPHNQQQGYPPNHPYGYQHHPQHPQHPQHGYGRPPMQGQIMQAPYGYGGYSHPHQPHPQHPQQGPHGHHMQQQFRKRKQLLMEQFIKKASARVLWSESSGVDTVLYTEIFNILRRELQQQTQSNRRINAEDWIEAFKKFGKMSIHHPNNNQPLNIQQYQVSIKYFSAVYEWFLGIIDLIKVLYEEWNEQNPCAIAGFISREHAVSRLKTTPIGTFLIRFSTSATKSIAISYKDVHSVEHIKGTLLSHSHSSKFQFAIKNHQQNQTEMSLASFIQKFKKITHLYDIKNSTTLPKVDVYFGRGKIDNNNHHGHNNDDAHSNHSSSRGNNVQHHVVPQPQPQHQHNHHGHPMNRHVVKPINSNNSTHSSQSSNSMHQHNHINNHQHPHNQYQHPHQHQHNMGYPQGAYM